MTQLTQLGKQIANLEGVSLPSRPKGLQVYPATNDMLRIRMDLYLTRDEFKALEEIINVEVLKRNFVKHYK